MTPGNKSSASSGKTSLSSSPVPGQKSGNTLPPASSAANRRPPRQATTTNVPPTMGRRSASRHQRDLERQRQLTIVTLVVIGLIAAVFLIGIFQSLVAPNIKTLAEVNGQTISSGDYYKFRKIQLFKEIGQIQQQAAYLQGDQANTAQQRIKQDEAELKDPSTKPVDQATLEGLISNIVLEKQAKDQFGISVNDDETKGYLKDLFLSSIYTPTPNATGSGATATSGAVNTAAGAIATSTANNTTPLPTNTPLPTTPTGTTAAGALTPQPTGTGSAANTTPGATTTGNLTPGASNASPGITATTTVTATATVTPTATSTSTPLAGDKVEATVSTNRNGFQDAFRKATGLSDSDYINLEMKPQLLKKRVSQRLLSQLPKVGDPYPQIKASHILLKEEATAKDILQQLKATSKDQFESKFIQLARDKSEDKSAAAHNGDLGWFIEGMMVDPFFQAAQKLDVGQLSDLVKTDFGYHLIWVTGKDNNRPLDAVEYNSLSTTDQQGDYVVFTKWLKKQVEAARPKYNTPPTPTTVPTQVPAPVFTPVIPPTETPAPLPTTAAPSQPGGTVGANTPLGVTGGATASGTSVAGNGSSPTSGAASAASPSGATLSATPTGTTKP